MFKSTLLVTILILVRILQRNRPRRKCVDEALPPAISAPQSVNVHVPSARDTLAGTPGIVFDQVSRHPVSRSSRHMKSDVTSSPLAKLAPDTLP